jgi:hypothetical protein
VALNGQRIIHFSVEMGMRIICYGQFFHTQENRVIRIVEFISYRVSY